MMNQRRWMVVAAGHYGITGYGVSRPGILPLFLVSKLRSVAQNEWKKTPIYNFSTFGSKINEFERKKSEKNEKIPKT